MFSDLVDFSGTVSLHLSIADRCCSSRHESLAFETDFVSFDGLYLDGLALLRSDFRVAGCILIWSSLVDENKRSGLRATIYMCVRKQLFWERKGIRVQESVSVRYGIWD